MKKSHQGRGRPPDSRPSGHSHVDAETRRERIGHPKLQFWTGIILSICFSVVNWALVARTDFGKSLEEWTYDYLQILFRSALKPTNIPVVVVDVSGAPVFVKDIDAQTQEVMTRRDSLQEIVDAAVNPLPVAGEKIDPPAAIGIDLNFSPDAKGMATVADWPFLNHLLDVGKRNGVCIYVGVHESATLGPNRWLFDPRFQALATCIAVPKSKQDQTTRAMPEWLNLQYDKSGGQSGAPAQCPTMGFALATALRRKTSAPAAEPAGAVSTVASRVTNEDSCDVVTDFKDPPLPKASVAAVPKLLRWFVESSEIVGDSTSVQGTQFRVDYSPLETLSTDPLSAQNGPEIGGIRRKIQRKVLLLGKTQNTPDMFVIPGRPERPYAGVFLHACAVYTLLQPRPLLSLTTWGQLALDMVFSSLIFGLVYLYRRRRINNPNQELFAEGMQQIVVLLSLVFLTFLFIASSAYARLMWDDFIFVIAALLLHAPVEHTGKTAWKTVAGMLQSA